MELSKAVQDAGLKEPTTESLLDCAVRIYNSENINKESNKPIPATEKQIDYLKKLGLTEIPENLTKKEAFQLIRERK